MATSTLIRTLYKLSFVVICRELAGVCIKGDGRICGRPQATLRTELPLADAETSLPALGLDRDENISLVEPPCIVDYRSMTCFEYICIVVLVLLLFYVLAEAALHLVYLY